MDYAADTGRVSVVLTSLQQAIKNVIGSIETAAATGNEEYAQFIADDEVDFIEELLGAAAIVCQKQAVGVASAAVRALGSVGVPTPDGRNGWNKSHLYEMGASQRLLPKSDVSLLNDVANFYKHQDEWQGDWVALDGLAKRTAQGAMMLGMRPGSTGNLRIASEALGNDRYDDLDVFLAIVENWSARVIGFCKPHLT